MVRNGRLRLILISARSHLERGRGWAYGASRGYGRHETCVKGVWRVRGGGRRTPLGIEGDPAGGLGGPVSSSKFRVASRSSVKFVGSTENST